MNGLGMLAQVVESRESSGTVALEGAFTRMFSGTCQYVDLHQT